MTTEKSIAFYQKFQSIFKLLNEKKIYKTESKKDISKLFFAVHDYFLYNYRPVGYFPEIFPKGIYNCVSASILYSLIFNQLNVPYKIYQTSNHVYLVAHPGRQSMIIETTNPSLKQEYFNGEFKKDYVQRLKSVKMVTDKDELSKSLDEIFHEKYYNGKETDFQSLYGFEYLNKALTRIQVDPNDDCYELLQKVYFFFPDPQIKTLLYNALIKKIEKCKYQDVKDIDYLIQFSRFDFNDIDKIISVFIEIIKFQELYTDKAEFCDSLYNYFIQEIPDKSIADDISFAYYLQRSKHYRNSDKMIPYIEKAIAIKQNHVEANNLFLSQIEKRLDRISGFDIINDSLTYLENKYPYKFVSELFADYRLIAYLNQAYNFFSYSKVSEGDFYLQQFENVCPFPIDLERKKLVRSIERTYRSLAIYYFYKGNKFKAQQTINRGLKFLPESRFIQMSVY